MNLLRTTVPRLACLALVLILMNSVLQPGIANATSSSEAIEIGATATSNTLIPENGVSGLWGTASWELSPEGRLEVGSGALPAGFSVQVQPWRSWQSEVKEIEFSDPTRTSFPSDSSNMFRELPVLQSIENIGAVDVSQVTKMGAMFHYSTHLRSLDVAHWDTSKVTEMTSLFCGAKELAELDVSRWETGNVTDMGAMFCETPDLKELAVSGWDTSKVTNMYALFAGSGVQQLDLGGWNTSKVKQFNSMFGDAKELRTVDVSGWDVRKAQTMEYMFYGTSVLAELDLSTWVGATAQANNMFRGATSLHTLHLTPSLALPSGVGLPSIVTGTGFTGRWVQAGAESSEIAWGGT